ncbi:MAG: ATP-binding protein [Dehalococcoidia bacterium]
MGGGFGRLAVAARHCGSSLRTRLTVVSLLTLLPALAIILLSVSEQRQQGVEAAQDQALQWATLAGERHARHLDNTQQTLATLARLPEVQNPDGGACPQLLEEVLAGNPLFVGMSITDLQGDVLCNARSLDEAVNFADRDWFQAVTQTEAPSIGRFQTGRISGQPVIPVAQPIFANGQLAGILTASLSVHWLNDALDTSPFPEGTRVTVLDQRGSVLSRHPYGEAWIGLPAPEQSTLRDRLAMEDNATGRGPGLEGDDRIFAFLRLEGGNGYVNISIPTNVALADANEALWRSAGLLLGGVLLALAVAWGAGHLFIMRPLRDLLQATQRVAGGDYSTRLGPSHAASEIGVFARDFDVMTEALEARREEREQFIASLEAARTRTEQAYRMLAGVASVLANSTDYQSTIDEAARAAVPALADGCLVHVSDGDGESRLAGAAHSDPGAAQALTEADSSRLKDQCPLWTILARTDDTGTRLIPNVEEAAQEAGVEDTPMMRLLSELGITRILAVPLQARGRRVGVMTLLGKSEWRYGDEQQEMAEQFGAICALAVDTASLYQREREARVAESEARREVTSILESITNGFFAVDKEWRFTYVNQEAEHLLQRTREELIGKSIWEEFPEAVAVSFFREYHRAVAEQSTLMMEEYYAPLDLWTEVHAFPSDGGLAVYFQDIGDRKKAEDALREADRRKDEFLAMLAHELRNPLAAILGAAMVNQDSGGSLGVPSRDASGPSAEGEADWGWEVVNRQARHMKRLLDDLLDISRITRGRITLQEERLDARDIMHRAVELTRLLMTEHGHHLHVNATASPIYLQGDPDRLSQVLANLLTNAAKYTPDGGEIRFLAEATVEDVVFRVKDNGIGIPPEALPTLFEPFVQVSDGSSGGLGLGLALVQKLVEFHGGTVEASSEGLGEGSEFIVRLPRLTGATTQTAPTAEPDTNRANEHEGYRVLLVDDNADLAKLTARMLRRAGYTVETAPDGPTALELARTFLPHAATLDIGLPGMSGLEVARELRLREETRDIRIVALSGYGQPSDIHQSKEAGCDAHLVKPASMQDIIAALHPSALESGEHSAPLH